MKFHHTFLGDVTLLDPTDETEFSVMDDDEFVTVVDASGERAAARKRTLTVVEETPPASTGSLNDLGDEILAVNISKGFHPEPGEETNVDRNLMLIVGELAEAQEELRKGNKVEDVYFADGKPEGFPIEIADVLIRTLGMCAELGIDIDAAVRTKIEFNRTRPWKHGKTY